MSKAYQKYLDKCKERRRSILDMYTRDGLTASQIGRKIGLSRQRVHQILHGFPEFVKRAPKSQRPTSASLPDD